MIDVCVYATIRYQAHKVNGFVVCFGISKGVFEYGLVFECVLPHRHIDFRQILIDHPTRTQIYVSDFAIAHLSFRKANVHTICVKYIVHGILAQAIYERRIGLCYC